MNSVLPEIDDRLEIIEFIGSGANSRVYRARHKLLDIDVAVKVLELNLADADLALKRFHKEAELLNSLNHKNIVRFFSFGKCPDGQPFMVLEYLKGKTLAQVLESGPLDTERALKIFDDISCGLVYAHERGITHRDIKPGNIMLVDLEAEETAKILDFGLFRRAEGSAGAQQLTQIGAVIGSPNYMSPEQCRGTVADARSDIYSFGCLMYEALVGAPPMVADSDFAILSNHLNTVVTKVPSRVRIAPELEKLVLKCLQKEPESRFQDAKSLLAELEQCPHTVAPKISKKILLIVLTALLIVLATAFIFQLDANHKAELAKSAAKSAEKGKSLEGVFLDSLKVGSDAKANLSLFLKWFEDNYQSIPKKYKTNADFGQLAKAYSLIGAYREILNEPAAGRDLAKKLTDLMKHDISRRSLNTQDDSTLAPVYQSFGRHIFVPYSIIGQLAITDDRYDDLKKLIAEIKEAKGATVPKNETLTSLYVLARQRSYNKDDYERALYWNQEEIDHYARKGVHNSALERKILRIEILHKMGNRAELLQLLKPCAKQFKELQKDPEAYDISRSLALYEILARVANKEGMPELTLLVLDNPFAMRLNDGLDKWARCRDHLAYALVRTGQFDRATALVHEMRVSELKANNIANVLRNDAKLLAFAARQNDEKKIDKVIDLYGADLARADKDPQPRGKILESLLFLDEAIVVDSNDSKQRVIESIPAHDLLFRKMAAFEKKYPIEFAIARTSRGHRMRYVGANRDAIKEYEAAHVGFARWHNQYVHGQLVAYCGEAGAFLALGEPKGALAVLDRADKLCPLGENPRVERISVDQTRVSVLQALGENEKAREHALKVVGITERALKAGSDNKEVESNLRLNFTRACVSYLDTFSQGSDLKDAAGFLKEHEAQFRTIWSVPPSPDDITSTTLRAQVSSRKARIAAWSGQKAEALALYNQAMQLLPSLSYYQSERDSLKDEMARILK